MFKYFIAMHYDVCNLLSNAAAKKSVEKCMEGRVGGRMDKGKMLIHKSRWKAYGCLLYF